GQVYGRFEVAVVSDVGDDGGDPSEHRELPATLKAERAAMRELCEVVEEADDGAAERDEEDKERIRGVVVERQKRDHPGREEQKSAHRRRALLGDVVLWPLGPDLLPVLPHAQETDEAGAEPDRDDQSEDAGDQNSDH